MRTEKQKLVDPAKCRHAKSYLKQSWHQTYDDSGNERWLQTDCKKCGTTIKIEELHTFYCKGDDYGY